MGHYNASNERTSHSLNNQDDSTKLEQSECSICLEAVNELQPKRVCTPCQHQFHLECIRRALALQSYCPYCRQVLPYDWLYNNHLVVKLSKEAYWNLVQESFGRPGYGPLIPSQQRIEDAAMYRRFGTPEIWDPTWIEDRLAETRMRFNIPADFVMSIDDLRAIEERGRHGILPEWVMPDWFQASIE